jgi:hypothetical protein
MIIFYGATTLKMSIPSFERPLLGSGLGFESVPERDFTSS